jgi:hypothetical protein
MAENRPSGHKIYQHLPLQDPPKFTQIGILGLKIYHLATLAGRRIRHSFVLRICTQIWIQNLKK